MSAPARRYCEDCRFCDASRSGLRTARCTAPQAQPVCPDGDQFISKQFDPPAIYAGTIRLNSAPNRCGPEAKWFEAKEATQQAAE